MKKLIVILAIIALLFVLFGVDSAIRSSYRLEIVSVDPQPAVADGQTPIYFSAQLTRNGEPVKGHTLYALPQNGSLYSARVVTDENGVADFMFYPPLANSFIAAKPVSVELYDENNSVFIYLPVTQKFEIQLLQPSGDEDTTSELTMDDIFGEN